ncbi:hypothetical protein OHA21_48295 [Actinoplanes sp. NBC_00393]|uniref:hypothetical protein n=1 Tax=Actinoplanes sp. NBC_00393 TaxID=2975953 RepID=UPI002E1B62D8
MEPTSSPDYNRSSPGLARFWQVRPEVDGAAEPPAADEPEMVALGSRRTADALETPADLLVGSPLIGTFGTPAPPLLPVASAARHPGVPGHGANGDRPPADPFGLNRAAGRTGSGPSRNPGAGRPFSGPPARSRHGDTDHSVPTEDGPEPVQDVKSQEPEGGDTGRESTFGGFVLGGRRGTGRFLFGSRNAAEPADDDRPDEPEAVAEAAEATEPGEPEAAETGDSPVADQPADDSAGATPADAPAEETPPEADQDAAEMAGPSDENGREDMNGRAGAPGYATTGEASGPDGKPVLPPPGLVGEVGEESPATPAEPPRPAAGWAAVPGLTHPVVPGPAGPATGPVSGAPVSPGFAPGAFGLPDFTPDHAAGTLEPVSGAPQPAAEPADPAATAPVSPAQPPTVQPPSATVQAVQIPATRTPPDLSVDRPTETPENGGYAGLPPSAEGAFGFSPAGYSLGRSGEAFGVASVTPAAPPPPEFQAFPPGVADSMVTGHAVGGTGRRGLEESEEPQPAPRRSASLEDVEPVRRAGRRSGRNDEAAPIAELSAAAAPVIGRTIWDDDAARHFRAAWHEVKAEFVDDPVTALTRAHDLLTDAVNELTEVLLAERDELDPLRGTDTPDTESMRMAMRGYREFLDRILSL